MRLSFPEEKVTTEYLKCLLETPDEDPQLWTVGDRRTALWWIFINSRADTMYTTSYQCPHCGETHYHDFDLRNLDQMIDILDVEPFLNVSVPVAGEPTEWHLHPLDGRAMEYLEMFRANLPPDTPETKEAYAQALIDLRVREFAGYCSLLAADETDFFASIEQRIELIRSMDISAEFPALAGYVATMQAGTAHGLPIETENGLSLLKTPSHTCTADKYKEVAPVNRPKTSLLVPFWCMQLIPDMGSNWLADVSAFPVSWWWSAHK